ncbi:hypothetical protein M885DRAFT_570715 [Pelagophyceae sp. CCMP2097]|nr:hypothetical protein M885DRAFT_570715 [Pelagophyceae sp. CCMP2097]
MRVLWRPGGRRCSLFAWVLCCAPSLSAAVDDVPRLPAAAASDGAACALQRQSYGRHAAATGAAHSGGQTQCRGWPMLARDFASTVYTTRHRLRCNAGDYERPCGFEVAACGGNSSLEALQVHVDVRGRSLHGLSAQVCDGGARLVVDFVPPFPGRYDVAARLLYRYDDAARCGGVYLGGVEARCAPRVKCKLPRGSVACDSVSKIPLAPTAFHVGPADASRREPPPACASDFDGGFWVQLDDAAAGPDALAAAVGAPEDPWRFWTRSGPLGHLDGVEAFRCLARRRVSRLVFIGDSLVRDVFEQVARRFEAPINKTDLFQRRFGENVHLETRQGGVGIKYAQVWGLADLDRLGLGSFDGGAPSLESWRAANDGVLNASGLFGGASAGARVVVVANLGLAHMPNAACGGFFVARTVAAIDTMARLARGRGLSLDFIFLAPPALLGLRNARMTDGMLAKFLEQVPDVAAAVFAKHGTAVRVDVLEAARALTVGRGDQVFGDADTPGRSDGLHVSGAVQPSLASALLRKLCRDDDRGKCAS